MRLPQRLRMISFIVLSLATLLVVACASEKETVTVVQTVVSEKVVEVEKVVVATATTTAEERAAAAVTPRKAVISGYLQLVACNHLTHYGLPHLQLETSLV